MTHLGVHTLGSTFVLCRPRKHPERDYYFSSLGVVMAVGISWTVCKILGRYSIFDRTPLLINFEKLAAKLLSLFSLSDFVRPQRWQPTRLPSPWDSPGKNLGVGCHFLLQCMKVKSESEVAQSCSTLGDPMDCSLPGSSVHGIFQARVLEWGAIAFSTLSSYQWCFSQS